MNEILVVGLGNVLLRDDGLGVRAIEALERAYVLPAGVRVLDGGTLGLALLGELAAASSVVLIDAVATSDDPPGALVRLTDADVEPAVRFRLSPHQVGVADLLDALRLIDRMPQSVALLGLTPATIELGTELSPAVAGALPALVALIAAELRTLGRPLVSRSPEGVATPFSALKPCAAERAVSTIRGVAPPPVHPAPVAAEWTPA